jgi:uncharacterized membrane protein
MKKVLLFVFAAVLTALPAAAQYHVKIIDCPDSQMTRLFGINDQGVAVGMVRDLNGKAHAMIYRDGVCESLQPLLRPEFPSSWGYGINNRGDVVGTQAGSGFLIRGGAVTYFDYPGAADSGPQAINDSGVIVGYFQTTDDSPLYGFKLDADGQFSQITLPFDNVYNVLPWGINARGDIVGDWDPDNINLGHAFILAKSGAQSFDVPQWLAIPLGTSGAGINDRGDLTGYFFGLDGTTVNGFVAIANQVIVLESPTGSGNLMPSAINNKRVVVGNFADATGKHGFVATPAKILYQ